MFARMIMQSPGKHLLQDLHAVCRPLFCSRLVAKYDNGGAGKTLEIPETGEDYEELLEKLGCKCRLN